MNELNLLIPKIIYDRSDLQKYGPYFLERRDGKESFSVKITKNGKHIIDIEYSKDGGKVTNIDATDEEIEIVLNEMNSCLSRKTVLVK